VPVEILIVDELPRTPSMKVSQAVLRARFERSDSAST
jgi:acyl-coenzyme A synthetase/AMP-(fatty) acid ligase